MPEANAGANHCDRQPFPDHPMRRSRQELSRNEIEGILARGTHGTLALIDADGFPYAVPVSYVWWQGRIYVHIARAGHKLDAIGACDRASFCVVDADDVKPEEFTTYFRSAIAFGHASIVTDADEKLASLQELGRKYWPDHEQELAAEISRGIDRLLMVRIDVDRLTGKQAKELVNRKDNNRDER